ncbi:MAG: hypothetical protein IJS08_18010 [Victivallales bacterium]|nr:hypothetical protein [Victivallales bacterium]
MIRRFLSAALLLVASVSFCEEMVKDGGAEEGTQLFNNGKTVEVQPFAGKNCTEITGKPAVGTQLIPVDAAKKYVFKGAFRAAGSARVSVGFQCYDKDQKMISCHNVKTVPGSFTTVLADAQKGATSMQVADASKWNLKAGRIVAFGAKEDFSDLPNRKYHYLVDKVTQTGEGWTVEFNKPLPWNVAAGTKIRLHADGSYMLTVGYKMISSEWQQWNAVVQGQIKDNSANNKFWPGTKFVKLYFHLHEGSLPVYLDNISLQPVEDGLGYVDTDFSGNELLSNWEYSGKNGVKSKDGITGSISAGSGFFFRTPEWDAKDIRQIEVDLASFGGPGNLTLTFKTTKDGRDLVGNITRNLHPDGKVHTTIFPVDEYFEWSGVVKELTLRAAGWDSMKCTLNAVRVSSFSNKIPNVKSIKPGEAVYIRDMLPRASYRLSWKGARNPGGTLELLDRKLGVVSKVRLGKEPSTFTAGELVVLARITLDGAGDGVPVLEKTGWTRNHFESEYWDANWIWSQREGGPEYTNVWFEKVFDLDEAPDVAVLATAVDDVSTLYVNGKCLGKGWPYYVAFRYNITKHLKAGRNVIRIQAYNGSGMGGAICEGYIHCPSGKEITLKSDESWRMSVGGDTMPEKIETPVVVVGPGKTAAPWRGRAGYRYIGKQGKVTVLKATEDGFDARLDLPLPKKIERLRFVARTASGKEYPLKLGIVPSQNEWKTGDIVHVRWQKKLVPMGEDYTLYLDDDYVVNNNVPVATVPKFKGPAPALSKVEILDAQTRPKLRINGKIQNPFFWLPGSRFHASPDRAFFAPDEATEANARITRVTVSAHSSWLAPDKFDFVEVERQILALLIEKPDAQILFNTHLCLPEWWLKAHPDSRGLAYDGTRLSPEYDSALSSQEWIDGACHFIRKFIEYVKAQPWADRVVAFCSCESMNGEWFWETNCEPKPNGRSKSDFKAFRTHLKEKYGSDEALRKAWHRNDVTLDNAPMPSYEEMAASKVGRLMDPKTQQNVCDWYEYRGLALAKAIIAFSKTVKENTDNGWMTQAYYGYYVTFAMQNSRPPQFVGHNGFLEVARSPYVDAVRAPSQYARRKLGDSDGIMQAQDSFLLRGKLVYIEEDRRTFLTSSEREYQFGYYDKPFESIADNVRSMGMMLASGISRYILEFNDWYCEKSLLEPLAEQQRVYMSLPPVAGTTPKEMAIVGSRESVHYTRFNGRDTVVNGTTLYLNRNVNRLAVSYRQLVVEDLLEEGLVPPLKFYIMTAPVILSKEQRAQLMARFAREKATVLWLYAAGPTYPGETPCAKACADFLGIEMDMEDKVINPVMQYGKGKSWANPTLGTPWFYPIKGFDHVLGKDKAGRPMLVSKSINGTVHYFATQMALPMELLRELTVKAGLFHYGENLNDQWWIGNDTVTLYAVSSGTRKVVLSEGCRMEAIVGPMKGSFRNGDSINVIAGQAYIFHVKK